MSRQCRNACIPKTAHGLRVNIGWEPPDLDKLRLDVDVGFDEAHNRSSVGAVVRDSNGVVRGAAACAIRTPGSVLGAELCAIRFGMELCHRQRMNNVCVFSDSTLAVNAIRNIAGDLGPNGLIVRDILSLMEAGAFLSVRYAPRKATTVAHTLAREALVFNNYVEWCNGDLPLWLSSVVNLDISN